MESQRFNLWDESWIYVTDEQFVLRKVSLMEALCNAHHFRDLAGETETQNFAMLRLLLAVLLTVFTRCDENGTDSPIEQPQQALKRWETIWNNGQFPAKPIQDYCNHWHQRFWLFDDSHPFFQVPEIDGTQSFAEKMNGALVESKNKIQLFSLRNGIQKKQLDDDEAARWLVYLQSFDDRAAKPTPRECWVSSIGCVFAKGESLFETLMLNFTLLKNSNEPWGTPKPCWECNTPKTEKMTEIPMPDNLPELYTLQCRRVKLQWEDGVVNSYIEAAGDYFEKESAFVEQMTFWVKKEEKGVEVIYPKIHDATRQMWRDFPTIMGINGEKCGVMKWIARLKTNNCLEKTKMVSFQIVGQVYIGTISCGVKDMFSDSLQFHATLLQDFRRELQEKISKEVENCEKLATAVYRLAEELENACGGNKKNSKDKAKVCNRAKEQFYHRVDIPFRQWLAELEPQQTPKEENQALKSWRKTAQTIARTLGREMVEQCGLQGFIGKKVKEKKNNKETEHQYNAPKAYQWFLYQTKL